MPGMSVSISRKAELLGRIEHYIASKGITVRIKQISPVINDISQLEITLGMLKFYERQRPRRIEDKDRYIPKRREPHNGCQEAMVHKSITTTNHTYKDKELLVGYIDAMAEEFRQRQKLRPGQHAVPLYASIPSIFYYGIINYLEVRAGVPKKERTCLELLQEQSK